MLVRINNCLNKDTVSLLSAGGFSIGSAINNGISLAAVEISPSAKSKKTH